jgi:hypothetical protein
MMTCCLVDVHRSFREACPFHSQSRNSSLRVGAVVSSERVGWVYRPSNRRTGHAVVQFVEALRYKPEVCGFDFRWCHWNFSFFVPIMALGLTQPLTEMSTRIISLGVKPVLRPRCIRPGRARTQVLLNQSKNTDPPIFKLQFVIFWFENFRGIDQKGDPYNWATPFPWKYATLFLLLSVHAYTIYPLPPSTTLEEQDLKRL